MLAYELQYNKRYCPVLQPLKIKASRQLQHFKRPAEDHNVNTR